MFMRVLARRDRLGVVLSAHGTSIPVKEAAGMVTERGKVLHPWKSSFR